jgi:SynChlorMet cassette protein ScmC
MQLGLGSGLRVALNQQDSQSVRPAYSIRLGQNLSWALAAAPDLKDWLDRFASILKLPPYDPACASPLIFFCLGSKWRLVRIARDVAGLVPDFFHEKTWERRKYNCVRAWTNPSSPNVICELLPFKTEGQGLLAMWQALQIVYRDVVIKGGLPLHSALIENADAGYLLVGGEGSGKSTSCGLLTPPWEAVSDDGVIIIPHSDGYMAHPLPTWSELISGRSNRQWDVRKGTRLRGVYFIGKAAEDGVARAGQGFSAVALSRSAAYLCSSGRVKGSDPGADVKRRIFENACAVVSRIPCFSLEISLTGKFWEKIGDG